MRHSTPNTVRFAMVARLAEEFHLAGSHVVVAPDEDRPLYIPDLNHPRRLEAIAERLAARGHSAAVIEKIVGGNFLRAFRDIWAVA